MPLTGRLARLSSSAAALLAVSGAFAFLSAATYLPLPDADLARRAPVVVRARVVSSEVRRGAADGEVRTATTLFVLESIRGGALAAGDTFTLELPGGRLGDLASSYPGTPEFQAGSETVLFLAPRGSGEFSLTEFGMSKFDIAADRSGRTFAVRPVFSDEEDDRASARRTARPSRASESAALPARELRDAESFLAMLRAVAAGEAAPAVTYSAPEGELAGASSPPLSTEWRRPLWMNIGGVEGSGPQYRWYWDTGLSPNAIVSASGTQTGLTDGSDGTSAVANGATQWSSVAGTTVRYSSSSGSAPVVVHLDVTNEPPAWTDALSCSSGGVIGYGGPGSARSAPPFKGEGNFYAPSSGNVWMRKVTGGCYSASIFRAAVLHELGHTLGLGHSDEGSSTHSTTAQSDWNAAVMHSVIPASHPSTPQADDIQAIQYYYGSGTSGPPAPVASFSFSPAAPAAGQVVSFTDASTGPPTAWLWSFGDGSSSVAASPTHAFASAGTYTVSLTVTNTSGSNTTTRSVAVGGCGAGALCLNGGRFLVTASWRVPSQGTSGVGVPVLLTGDTGYFWFFSSNNVELVVKVVDGSAFNGRFWFFSGALSDVEYTVQVTDTHTGAVRTYFNPQGTLASRSDTAAFAVSTLLQQRRAQRVMPERRAIGAASDDAAAPAIEAAPAPPLEGACSAGANALCLNGGRFRVSVDWQVPSQGTSGSGVAVPLTSDTGYFWFFSSNNVELVVKVVDGRSFNGRFWVFSGALSDVAYTITVTDTATGAVRRYANPFGRLSSFSDVSAF